MAIFIRDVLNTNDPRMCGLQVLVFSESLVPTVRKALCDPLEEVREAAAKTFEQLHATIGHQALDDILPALLKQLVRQRGHES